MATSPQESGPTLAASVTQQATGGSVAERNTALVRHFFEAGVNGPDMALIDRLLSPDFTISHNVRASALQGPPAFRDVCGAFFTAFPDLQVTLQDVFGAGDRVAAELLVGGTNTGDWLGHPPTGRRVTYKAIALVTVAGERITHLELLDDYSSILQQLGLVVMPEVSRH